jgi:hypothetical protein
MQPIHTVPGKLFTEWAPEAHAMVDHWKSYFVTVAEFRDAVLVKGLAHAKANGGRAWIADSSEAKGAFPSEIQALIGSDVFPAFAKAGIKYFITIKSSSAVTNLTVATYTAKLGPNGIQLAELPSVEAALEWLKGKP